MNPRSERRRAQRVRTSLAGRLLLADGSCLDLAIDDLSLVGLHGFVTAPLSQGTQCRIELFTGSDGVEVRGTVVRARDLELAIRFDYLPFEDFEALKAFLLLHAKDPAVIADELTERLGFLEERA